MAIFFTNAAKLYQKGELNRIPHIKIENRKKIYTNYKSNNFEKAHKLIKSIEKYSIHEVYNVCVLFTYFPFGQ